MYADNSYNMTQTYDVKAKSEKRKAKSEKQKESRLWRNECLHMACLIDVKHSLSNSLTRSLTYSLTHVLSYLTVKHEAHLLSKSEKRKAKNKNNIDFDQMNVCVCHELFDWRKKLTHSLSNSLTHSDTHSLIHVLRHLTVTTWKRPMIEKRKAKSKLTSERRKAKSEK